MKHNVTPLNDEKKLLAFAELMFGNCLLETKFGCYPTRLAPTPLDMQLVLLPCPTDGDETCAVHCANNSSSSRNSSNNSTSMPNGLCTDKLWAMDLTNQRHTMAQGLGVSQSPKIIENA